MSPTIDMREQRVAKQIVAVTGASGFIGRVLVDALAKGDRTSVRACYRSLPEQPPRFASAYEVGDVVDGDRWGPALAGATAVVHTAARVHVMQESEADALAAYRRVNVEGTLRLARAAAAAGARRFVFLSSIKVNGESTPIDRPFTAEDAPAPQDPYGVSKREAEEELRAFASASGLEIVILRLPLVYGPGAKGNLERLMRLVARGTPLPLGRIANRRSMIGLANLASVVATCVTHPGAANRTFLLSDQEDLSTPELITAIGKAMGKRPLLIPVPSAALRLAGALTGRGAEIDRLSGSLRVDGTPISAATGWHPSVPVRDGIAEMVKAFTTRNG
jgi:nucleoside-diphosphate-sugar epimerase